MRALQPTELLAIWEAGQGQAPPRRALLLLAAAYPELSAQELAQLSIGQRDACLLRLREWAFGGQVAAVARCPHCGQRLDLSFELGQIVTPEAHATEEPLTLALAGYELQVRLPNSADLAAIGALRDLPSARGALFERCLLAARYHGRPLLASELPPELVAEVGAHMSRVDPQADIQLALDCPHCGQEGLVTFDILAYFWSEIETWARGMLGEVHLLASAYGWSEAEILALSPRRRQMYLELINA